jgi:hypothetical protein
MNRVGFISWVITTAMNQDRCIRTAPGTILFTRMHQSTGTTTGGSERVTGETRVRVGLEMNLRSLLSGLLLQRTIGN